jgi:endonuclease YncB( thermonuclease family)
MIMGTMLSISLLASGFLAAGPPDTPTASASTPLYKVILIPSDGESVILATEPGTARVKLCGVLLPEGLHEGGCLALRRQALTELLSGQRVCVKCDTPLQLASGRVVSAHLYRASDGLEVNQEMLRRGYGVASAACHLSVEERVRAEQDARAKHLGIWSPEKLSEATASYERGRADRQSRWEGEIRARAERRQALEDMRRNAAIAMWAQKNDNDKRKNPRDERRYEDGP